MTKRLLLLTLFCTTIASAQKLELWQAKFPTRISSDGDAKYSYTVNPQNKKEIRQGAFTYTLRITRDFAKLNQDVKGNYVNGFKEGYWQNKVVIRDFKPSGSKQESFETGSFSLSNGYLDGMPYGKWVYNYNIKGRKTLSVQADRVTWGKYTAADLRHIAFNLNNGLMVDSFSIETPNLTVFGQLTYTGLLDGDWYIRRGDIQEIESYMNGFLIKYEKRDVKRDVLLDSINNQALYDQRVLKIEEFINSDPAKLKLLNFALDTISLLADNTNSYTKVLHSYIFDNDYFLFSEVEGARINNDQIKGLSKVVIVNQATDAEKVKIKQIRDLSSQISNIHTEMIKYTQNTTSFDELENIMKILFYYRKVGEKYNCLTDIYISSEDMITANKQANNACKQTVSLTETIPQFKSRGEALDFFISDLTDRKIKAEAFKIRIKEKLVPQKK